MEEHMKTQRVELRRLFTMIVLGIIAILYLCAGVVAQDMSAHHHPSVSAAMDADTETIQDWAKQQLAKSPRHHEWVKIKNGNREVNSFVVYPEVSKKATAVIVIHEIFRHE